jgi:Zn-dependent peptidase ImmA (M78 family)/transcriptional regulator with XRE-family HTH domain
MTAGMRAFRGARLREARLARGLFKNALADMVGITGTAITRYEENVDKPQQERLAALAKNLNFPIEFFLKPEWPEQPAIVHWRSRVAETKYAREMTEQRMVWLAEIFAFLEREVNFPVVNLPRLDLPKDFRALTPDMIERAAEDTRKYWKLRDLPISDVCLALENAGIPVVNLEITSDKQDGFFFYSYTLDRPFVGINTYQISAARARYDASHELGHAILHRDVTLSQLRDPALNKRIEQQAHLFAGAFLFPRDSFRHEVAAPTLDYFSALKKRWGMSIAAMIYRAGILGMIDEFEKVDLYKKLTRRQWRGPLQEPFDDPSEMPLEKPRMLRRAINVMLGEGYTRETLRAAIGLPDKETEQIVGLEKGFFQTADLVQLATPKPRSNLKAVDVESGEVIEFPQRRNST